MKKAIFLLTLVCIVLSGCVTNDITREEITSIGNIDQIPLVAKDYIIVGRIYVTSSATIDPRGMIIEGSPVTLEMLLAEAKKLNADEIVNLKTDEVIRVEQIQTLKTNHIGLNKWLTTANETTTTKTVITYSATALAIKYK